MVLFTPENKNESKETQNPQDQQVNLDASILESIPLVEQYPGIEKRAIFRPIISKRPRNIVNALAKSYAHQLTPWVTPPMMLTHIVTTRCNYSCHFCSFADSLNKKTNELSLEEIEKTYETMGDNMNVIVYSGGETTLRKDLAEIIEAAYRHTPIKSAYIISNAWKPERVFEITHQVMQRCPELHLTWSLSIEGPHEYNNSIRHNSTHSWDAWQNTIDTMNGLKQMRDAFDYSQLDVQLCTVCSPDNHYLMNEWYESVKTELKPDKWNLNLMRRSVQMDDSQLESFESRREKQELEPFEQTYLSITEKVREDVISGNLKFLYHTQNPLDGAIKSAVDLLSQDENRNTVTQNPLSFKCCAGSTGAYLGSEGEVSGCEEFANNPVDYKSMGNLRNNDFDFMKIWRSKRGDKIRSQVNNSAECKGCTLESQRNYPSLLMSPSMLAKGVGLAVQIIRQK